MNSILRESKIKTYDMVIYLAIMNLNNESAYSNKGKFEGDLFRIINTNN